MKKSILICNDCPLNSNKITPMLADCLIFGCGIIGEVSCKTFFKRFKLLMFFIYQKYWKTVSDNEKIEKKYKKMKKGLSGNKNEIRRGFYKARKNQTKLTIYTGLKNIYFISILDDKRDFAPSISTILPTKKDGIKVNIKAGSSGKWEAIGDLDE